MFKINFKKTLINLTTVFVIFLVDRAFKVYILKIGEINSDETEAAIQASKIIKYSSFISKPHKKKQADGIKKYSLIFVLGGALGNLYDRINYSAVPDFIDFHINEYHWFVFNVADIFITLGVICLILIELFDKKNK